MILNKGLSTYIFILIQSEDKKNLEAMSKMKNRRFEELWRQFYSFDEAILLFDFFT